MKYNVETIGKKNKNEKELNSIETAGSE